MLWVKAFHIIAMVTWFAGLFYLPRLFVYHAESTDAISDQRFQLMERKLYYGIMTPGAVLTLLLGAWLMSENFSAYMHAGWMHLKLLLVMVLIVFHVYCGKLRKDFQRGKNKHTHVFYRWLNEVPTVLLIGIVILVVVKPF
jgi:protoporphyrinogen IX oxidase